MTIGARPFTHGWHCASDDFLPCDCGLAQHDAEIRAEALEAARQRIVDAWPLDDYGEPDPQMMAPVIRALLADTEQSK